MTDPASGGQPPPSVVEIRPSVRRLLGQWAVATTVGVLLYRSMAEDARAFVVPALAFSLIGLLQYRHQRVVLTQTGMRFRTGLFSSVLEIPWWAIQSITLGRGFFPGIVVHLGGWDNVMGRSNRVRLDYGPGGLFARRSHESVRAQIESWWLEHRGAEWRPVAPAGPLRFPPGVDPYAPPAHD